VLEGLLDRNTRRGVESQHVVQKIQRIGVGVGEELREWSLGHEWEVAHIFLSSWGANAGKGFLVRCTKDMEDLVELVDIISALEERTSTKQFSKDTTNRPHVNYFGQFFSF
jgi:hypothetical protein